MHVSLFLQTPELLADIEVPESVSILGQTVDLSQVRGLLQPVSQGLSGIISQASHIGWGSGQGGGGGLGVGGGYGMWGAATDPGSGAWVKDLGEGGRWPKWRETGARDVTGRI